MFWNVVFCFIFRKDDFMNYPENHATLGIDIGSTTVKIAILDEKHNILFSDYERH